MNFKNQALHSTVGHFYAVPDTYTGSFVNVDPTTLPEGAIILDATQPNFDLAVRLATGTVAPVSILGSEVAVNVSNRVVGRDPKATLALANTLRHELQEAGAPANIIESPRNFGGPTIVSFLADPSDDLKAFAIELCNGNADLNEAYNGSQPPDRRREGVGNDGIYSVLTDDMATSAATTAASGRLDTMLAATPEFLHKYIDSATVIHDMLLTENGGRGGLLATDGTEVKVTLLDPDGVPADYFVYRKD